MTQPAKRLEFFEKQDWGRLQQLLVDAGMLHADKQTGSIRRASACIFFEPDYLFTLSESASDDQVDSAIGLNFIKDDIGLEAEL